ncbi:MAG TPA: isoamylase early set domain-containing protein [Candidatus Krumholzibacteria bacterium]|nr:isoamylase early set domain-containing protein [Candidatus Krumholzibacteria bacterium]
MSLQKRYLKTREVSKVTFRLPAEAAPAAAAVMLVGDFNGWDPQATPMTRLRNGEYKVTLDLEPGREYGYRFLIDGAVWENDWEADKYAPSGFADAENSVVIV